MNTIGKNFRESRSIQILWDATRNFRNDNGWVMASHLAMSALLSLFPFLICVTSLIGVLNLDVNPDTLTNALLETWPKVAADTIAGEIHSILTEPRTEWLTFGFIVVIWVASTGIEALRTAMNSAYGLEEDRSLAYRRLQSILLVFVGAIGFVTFSFLIVLAPVLWSYASNWIPFLSQFELVFDLLRYGFAAILLSVCLYICHSVLPNGKHSMREIIVGIAATLVLWVVVGSVFGAYLENFSNYASTYAGLAGIMTAVVFLYLISLLFIFGGELNGAIIRFHERGDPNQVKNVVPEDKA